MATVSALRFSSIFFFSLFFSLLLFFHLIRSIKVSVVFVLMLQSLPNFQIEFFTIMNWKWVNQQYMYISIWKMPCIVRWVYLHSISLENFKKWILFTRSSRIISTWWCCSLSFHFLFARLFIVVVLLWFIVVSNVRFFCLPKNFFEKNKKNVISVWHVNKNDAIWLAEKNLPLFCIFSFFFRSEVWMFAVCIQFVSCFISAFFSIDFQCFQMFMAKKKIEKLN